MNFKKQQMADIISQQKMGNTHQTSSSSNFSEKLTYIQTIENSQFGRIAIFRLKEPPYDYVMRFTSVLPTEFTDSTKAANLLEQIKRKSHRCVAKIHQVKYVQEQMICSKNSMLQAYCSYFNFTLKQAIDKKKIIHRKFSEGELWYILGTLLDLGRFLQSMDLSFGDYCSSNLYLSHDGHYLRVYLLTICPDNRHNAYFKVLTNKKLIGKHLLSPQQLQLIRREEYYMDFDVYKSDIFSIGMLILELVSMGNIKFYDDSKLELNKTLVNSILNQIKKKYSPELYNILRGCLEIDPLCRTDFNEAMMNIQSIQAKVPYSSSIKLIYDQEEEVSVIEKDKILQKKLSDSQADKINWTPLKIDLKLITIPTPMRQRRSSLYSSTVTNKTSTRTPSQGKSTRNSKVFTSKKISSGFEL